MKLKMKSRVMPLATGVQADHGRNFNSVSRDELLSVLGSKSVSVSNKRHDPDSDTDSDPEN